MLASSVTLDSARNSKTVRDGANAAEERSHLEPGDQQMAASLPTHTKGFCTPPIQHAQLAQRCVATLFADMEALGTLPQQIRHVHFVLLPKSHSRITVSQSVPHLVPCGFRLER